MTVRLPPAQVVRAMACAILLWLILFYVIQTSHEKMLLILSRRTASTTGSAALIPNGAALKHISLGYDQLLADCWWLAFIQYYGDNKARLKDHYRLAYKYLDLVTQLDPKFSQPYWFSAFAVGSEYGRPDLADRLIARGLHANQDDWYLPFIAGINQYLFAHNEPAAAKYYRMAAKFPNAPKWLGPQANILEAHGPSLLKEINTWANIYLSTRDELVKKEAAGKLKELWLTVYRTVPSEGARKRAVEQLKALGVEIEQEGKK